MMRSTDEAEVNNRPASSPPSPTLGSACSPAFCQPFDSRARRHSTSSLSRVRESIRRRSMHIQTMLGNKISQMANLHLDKNSPICQPGLIFHLTDLPLDHRRESVVHILHQSVEWLRGNPGQGKSPFVQTSIDRPPSPPNLLDIDSDLDSFTALQPTVSHTSQHQPSITTVAFCPRNTSRTEEVFPDPGTNSPTPFGILIDLEPQTDPTPQVQHGTKPINDELFVDQANHDKGVVHGDIHPDLRFLTSAFETNPRSQKSSPALMTFPKFSPSHRWKGREVDDKSVKHEKNRQYDANAFRETYTPQAFQPSSPALPHRRPDSYSHTPAYLGFGLQSMPLQLQSPKPAVMPAPPATATSSTEFLDRNGQILNPHVSTKGSGRLNRKRNDQDLRGTCLGRPQESSKPNPVLVEQPTTQPKPVPAYNNVAEKISRFEKPLPELPSSRDTQKPPPLRISTRRFAIYGPPATFRDGWPPSPLPQTEAGAATKGIKAQPEINPRPFGEFQPYRPTPPRPFGEFQPYRPSTPTPTAKPQSPALPPIPHIRKGSMLRQIKRQLFPEDKESDSIPPPIFQTSLLENNRQSDKEAKDQYNGYSLPPPSYLGSALKIPDSPQSSIIGRQGTLQQLGGRVIQIRNRFEEQEQHHASLNIMSPTTPRKHSSTHRRITIRHQANDTRSPDTTSSPPSSSYTHTNHHTNSTLHRTITPSQRTAPKPPTSPMPLNKPSNTYHHDPTNPPNLYAVLHPNLPHPETLRAAMSRSTQQRLCTAADEVDMAATWARTVETGRDSELIRKLDCATNWQWKRFSDADFHVREREEMERIKAKKGKGKARETTNRR